MVPTTVWRGQPVTAPPQGQTFLVADDNDGYADALGQDLQGRGGRMLRARSAREGIALFQAHRAALDGVITDIDMETQLAGMRLVYHINRAKFSGSLTVTTTGLDASWAFAWNRWVFTRLFPVDYLIPKRPIRRRGEVLWLRTAARRRVVLCSDHGGNR